MSVLLAVVSISLLSCIAAAPLIGPAAIAGAGVLSDADQEKLAEYTARNFGVERSRIAISDIEKEGNVITAGITGRRIHYNVDVLPDSNSGESAETSKYRCQVNWSVFTKSAPLCSNIGQPPLLPGSPSVADKPPQVTSDGTMPPHSKATNSALGRDQIKQAQSALNSLGYNAGQEDGLLGPRTTSAITAFQRDKGIPVTGVPDQQTLSALGI